MDILGNLLATVLLPSRLGISLVLIGAILACSEKHRRLGMRAVLTAAILIWLASLPLVSESLVRSLESKTPPFSVEFNDNQPPWIAVLGGGTGRMMDRPASQQLFKASLARLVEGCRVSRMLPNAQIIVSGGYEDDRDATARMMRDAGLEIGWNADRIVIIDGALSTHDEIRALVPVVGDERVVLVTSALHLPRAVSLASAYGIDSLGAPCDFSSDRNAADWHDLIMWLPCSSGLSKTDEAVHEIGARMWNRAFLRR